jgi:3-carboxy-cis,cis-muconate cycloisomerase
MTADRRLHARLLGDPDLLDRFDGQAQLQAMLDVEAALADAEAEVGVVPAACVAPIRAAADAGLYDIARLAEEAVDAGNPAIPMVRHLTERVAAADPEAARYVHWGATSQDVMDTGLVLQLRAAVPPVAGHLRRAGSAAAGLARRYADAAMPGRTWLQQATPTTFGLKAAGWADALGRTRLQVETALEGALVLQLGGAAGTLASLGARGLAVTDALAARLDLKAAATPWHAHRDRFAHLGCALGVAGGAAGKIARDLSLLAQTEVAEAAEGAAAGRGGSSTMPQKRNPVSASVALAAAGRTPAMQAIHLRCADPDSLLGEIRDVVVTEAHANSLAGAWPGRPPSPPPIRSAAQDAQSLAR